MMRCRFSLLLLILAVIICVSAQPKTPNILYLISDDMRPELGCYGHSWMKSPNLDALAKSGLVFEYAYTNFAYCAPSRNSFMTGRRPDRTRCLNFLVDFRQLNKSKNWVAMPEYFKNKGYFTSSAGKVYHDGMDDPKSWSYPSNQTHWIQCQKSDKMGYFENFCEVTNSSEHDFTDEDMILFEGLKRMDLASKSGKPWWVSIGIHRPHWAWRLPEGFYGPEVYPEGVNDVVLPPKHPGPPQNAPWMSGNWYAGDIRDPDHGCPTCEVPSNRSVAYRRWYYAAVTYADHMLGKALERLESYGKDVVENTIVVFHADHGYQLGELNEWSKKTDTELATRVPLIMRVPWKANSIGKRTMVKAELVDMYKTLAELTNLGPVEETVQGTSLAPVFDNPDSPPTDLTSKVAYSQIGRCGCRVYPERHNSQECDRGACAKVPLSEFDFMGYTVRNGKWRFTAWPRWDNKTMKVDWSKTEGFELMNVAEDKGNDFDFAGYSYNLAGEPQYKDLVSQMFEDLKNAVNNWY